MQKLNTFAEGGKLRISPTSGSDLRKAAKPRDLYGSKKDNGNVLVIAGSSNYHGAASLASNAAQNVLASLRTGAGYARAYVPKAILNPVRSLSPSTIVNALGTNHIVCNAEVKRAVERSDAVAIGMGIGREKKTLLETSRILDFAFSEEKKTVIDADAIYAIRLARKKMNLNVVITPQEREFSALSGKVLDKKNLNSRIKAAVAVARSLSTNVVLKGHVTIITNGKDVKLNRSRSSALATMGTGDVLSGIIAGYAATGTDVFEAAVAGVRLHSMIGDRLAVRMGNHIISSDVVECIPHVLRNFDRNSG